MAGQKRSLAEFMVDAPLYVEMPVTDRAMREPHLEMALSAAVIGPGRPGPVPEPDRVMLPKTIRRRCDSKACGADLQWDLGAPEYAFFTNENFVTYRCRNCRQALIVAFALRVKGTEVLETKFGQLPARSIPLPKDLESALCAAAELWKKGMRSRHQGYGIGAMAYIRRVVEDSTGRLLELLADAMAAGGEPEADVEAVRVLIKAKAPFATKMELAAKMIPTSLRPGGANPFQTTFEIVSTDLHGSTDEECCALVDALSGAMLVLVGRLNRHIAEQKETAAAATMLERFRADREKKSQGSDAG
jgi:hypothetical protein